MDYIQINKARAHPHGVKRVLYPETRDRSNNVNFSLLISHL